ncbi:GtrA family protein [Thermomonas fusca]|uniref:GtrA family protein n=1 Tax=Thermomonas fusca TaxID=215690 RepID=UPI001FEAD8B9|nr:GtrA family protein [Thermomonas fusca]
MSTPSTISGLPRQAIAYFIVGGVALCVDWAAFVWMTWLELGTAPANLGARLLGALVAYSLNGLFTFREEGASKLGWQRMLRYGVLWCGMTVASTAALVMVNRVLGVQVAWLAKPLVELVLAACSFLACKYWVYK